MRSVVFLLVAACTGDDHTTIVEEQAMLASPCDGLVLHARRTANTSVDGHAELTSGALAFDVPATIPVIEGAAGKGTLTFTYYEGTQSHVICVYRGHDKHAHRGPYELASCKRSGSGQAADHGVAHRFVVHIEKADKAFPTTRVRLELPPPSVVSDNDACTIDACDPTTGSTTHTVIALDDGDACTTDACSGDTGPRHTPVDSPVCRGRTNFHDRTLAGLGGNGRACVDCHMETESFQLSPAAARARFDAMTASGIDDPLFRPIDADDFRTLGAAAHDYTNLIENGLVRVTIPLPANVRLLDCGAAVPCPASAAPTSETVADVWRAVPSINDVDITGPDGSGPVWPRGPNQRGGYQLDGRIATLQDQALGALRGHAAVAIDPPASWLDDIAAFQRTQFSSARVRTLAAAMAAATMPLPDPDPTLDALEAQGRIVFDRACGHCHGNLDAHPSGSTPILQGTPGTPTALVRYHSITTSCPRPVDTVSPPRFAFAPCSASQLENVRTYEIANSGVAPTGTPCGGPAPQPPCITRVTTSDPGRLLLTGFPQPGGPGDIEHLDIPSVRGLARTAPYFSNNTAATLEDVVEHYKQFFRRVAVTAPAAPLLTTQPGVVPPVHDRPFTDAEVPALLAYLRAI